MELNEVLTIRELTREVVAELLPEVEGLTLAMALEFVFEDES